MSKTRARNSSEGKSPDERRGPEARRVQHTIERLETIHGWITEYWPIFNRLLDDSRTAPVWKLVAKDPASLPKFMWALREAIDISKNPTQIAFGKARSLKRVAEIRKAIPPLQEYFSAQASLAPVRRTTKSVRTFIKRARGLLDHLEWADGVLASIQTKDLPEFFSTIPTTRKIHAKSAGPSIFVQTMARTMESLYGRPCDEEIACLVNVIFDRGADHAVGTEAVRSARRPRGAAKRSSGKSEP